MTMLERVFRTPGCGGALRSLVCAAAQMGGGGPAAPCMSWPALAVAGGRSARLPAHTPPALASTTRHPTFICRPADVLPGEFMLQNVCSLVAAHALAPPPGARVLDMCAAPGGKTTALAQLMRDSGEVRRGRVGPRCLGSRAAGAGRAGQRCSWRS